LDHFKLTLSSRKRPRAASEPGRRGCADIDASAAEKLPVPVLRFEATFF
jgi:hypothetical protein